MLALLHFPVQSGMSLIEALLFPPLFISSFLHAATNWKANSPCVVVVTKKSLVSLNNPHSSLRFHILTREGRERHSWGKIGREEKRKVFFFSPFSSFPFNSPSLWQSKSLATPCIKKWEMAQDESNDWIRLRTSLVMGLGTISIEDSNSLWWMD